jgi:hypothetical protein
LNRGLGMVCYFSKLLPRDDFLFSKLLPRDGL